jgi:hypothetical protein
MILQLFKLIKCLFFSHSYTDAGKCPFTMKEYLGCIKCNKIVVKQ